MNKVYITNADFHRMITKLTSDIVGRNRNKYKAIVGIANGGLPISHCLSYFLSLPHFTTTIRLRDDPEHTDKWDKEAWTFGTPFLLVDDIIDSGDTLRYFKHFPYLQGVDFDVATLHWCPENSGDEKPDFYVATKKVTDWIVYPWEKEYES